MASESGENSVAVIDSLIYDKKQIEKFEEIFRNVLDDVHVCLINVVSRRKYSEYKHNKNKNRQILKRQIIKNDTDIISFLNECDLYIQSYYNDVDYQSLVAYYTINPKNMITAYTDFSAKVDARIKDCLVNQVTNRFNDLDKLLNSCIFKSTGSKRYMELDIDTKDDVIISKVMEIITSKSIEITKYLRCTIETKNGYHVILEDVPKNIKSVLWKHFQKDDEFKFNGENISGDNILKSYVEILSNPQPPIPGTRQGLFPVKFIDLMSLDKKKLIS